MFGVDLVDIIIIIFGVLLLAIWLFFYIKGNKYNSLFEGLVEKDYPLKEVYGIGYAVLETIKYNYKSKYDRKQRQYLAVLHGEKYADYYLRVVRSQQITISFTVLVLAPILYCFTMDILVMGIIAIFAGTAYYYFGNAIKTKIATRSEEMLSDFANVVSKLALLTNAGMILKEAWTEVAQSDSNRVIYEEMRLAVIDMENGMADVDAIYKFGMRCILPEIKKFTSTIVQGIKKGNSELSSMLQEQSHEVWGLKKQMVKRQAEKAASKLLIPMCIMFVGILIMILVPIFTNIGI